MQFDTANISERHGRESNMDFMGCSLVEGVGCWAMADGLGGHYGSDVASRLAVEEVIASFTEDPEVSAAALKRHIDGAQQAILQRQREEPALDSMRTTLVVLLADQQGAFWGHVGDSRLYYFQDGRLKFQTRDHSVPQSLVNAGEIAPEEVRFHEDRNRLLRALGQEGEVNPALETRKWPLSPGDAFLLCTDGFWEYVTETEMEVDLGKVINPEQWLAKMQSRLLRHILEHVKPHGDNYSAMAVFLTD
jgi:serine/threonine protein phosphatase PrpC